MIETSKCEIACTFDAFMKHAASLFRMLPIEAVTITDRRPLYCFKDAESSVVGYTFATADTSRGSDDSVISSDIIRLAAGGFYSTIDEAMNALSAACLAYGRQAASQDPDESYRKLFRRRT